MSKKFDAYIFRPEHVDMMEIQEDEMLGFMTLKDLKERFKNLAELSIGAWTFAIDGDLLFCAGYYEVWPGVVEGWILPSTRVKDEVPTFTHIVEQFLENEIGGSGIHRFQAAVKADATHERFMRYLGFKKEGTMEKYSHNKKDYTMFARLF